MCLILFALEAHPRYDLILLANRDEEYERPTEPLHRWREDPRVAGGRDRKEGGAWFGIREDGRLAAVTNVREPGRPGGSRSRGLLVKEYLLSRESPERFAEGVAAEGGAFGGFNLLLGDRERLLWISNRRKGVTTIDPGCHGLSNAALDTPWPKVTAGLAGLERLLKEECPETEPLFDLLTDTTRPPDRDLPDTGVGLSVERKLGSIFIEGETYGTRSSTIVLRERSGRVVVEERTWKLADAGGVEEGGRTRLVLP